MSRKMVWEMTSMYEQENELPFMKDIWNEEKEERVIAMFGACITRYTSYQNGGYREEEQV